jgi:hypothetical protein
MYVSIRAPDLRTQKLILKSLERGPMERFLKPRNDGVFERVFGTEQNKEFVEVASKHMRVAVCNGV